MYKNTYKRRSLEDLTLKDNFLFTAVMSDPENCKQLLQIILKVEIDRVEVDYEKCIITHPEYRSIRLDVYVKDEKGTRYNIEMQVASENTYIHRLQDSITEIKRNRIWGDRFMRLEELIEREKRASRKEGYEDGKSEGLAEGKAEGLAEGKALTLSHFKTSILTLARSKNCDASFLKRIESCNNPEELVSLHEECFKFDH